MNANVFYIESKIRFEIYKELEAKEANNKMLVPFKCLQNCLNNNFLRYLCSEPKVCPKIVSLFVDFYRQFSLILLKIYTNIINIILFRKKLHFLWMRGSFAISNEISIIYLILKWVEPCLRVPIVVRKFHNLHEKSCLLYR